MKTICLQVVLCFAVVACGDDYTPLIICVPGEIQSCSCGSGEPNGTQTCLDGLTFGECDCAGGDSDTDSDTDTDTDGDVDADTDTDSNSVCMETAYDIKYNSINFFILLDRSRSMFLNEVGGSTYASVISEGIENMVATYDPLDLIHFGLGVFPTPECFDGDTDSPRICLPASSPLNPLVEVKLESEIEMNIALDAIGTCGKTPTCQSLLWTREYLANDLQPEMADFPTSVLLITDGAPNCNPSLDPATCDCTHPFCQFPEQCLDDVCTYDAAMQLASAGIPVYLVGFGDELALYGDVMDNIAFFGGTAQFYPASDPADIPSVLEYIAEQAMQCTFSVDWDEVDPGNLLNVPKACTKVKVYAYEDQQIPDLHEELIYSCDCSLDSPTTSAWHWLYDTCSYTDYTSLEQCQEIELCPFACHNLKNTDYWQIRAGFGCAPIVPE